MDKIKYGFRWWVWYECKRKKAYTKKAAEAKAIERNDPLLHAYQCYHCTGWHLGHRSKMYNR